ncbi:MAG: LCP family protein [Butyrivibrio sp.]|nr:LCP family protein [Butyrivibrio sp.]
MAKYKDFDDDYDYDDEDIYEAPRRGRRSRISEEAYTDEEEYVETRRAPKKRKGIKRWVLALIFAVEIILLLVLLLLWYVIGKINMIEYTPINKDAIVINPDLDKNYTEEVLEGYTNILLLGTDIRDNGSKDVLFKVGENHTDAILVASINNKTKEVRLVSVYRDTILQMSDVNNAGEPKFDKATEAIFWYGIESAISMVNINLDLDIQDYIMVNWEALIQIIDAVGGIDIEINDTELYWINAYLHDTSENTGRDFEYVEHSGYVHLDGIQATSYCRIRYGGGSDYRRTERQRTVISLVLQKAKSIDITQLNSAINSIFGNVATSLELKEILDLAKSVTSYTLTDTAGLPFSLTDQIQYPAGLPNISDPVFPTTLEDSVVQLHKFLFDTEDYSVSDTVKSISDEIASIVAAGKRKENDF